MTSCSTPKPSFRAPFGTRMALLVASLALAGYAAMPLEACARSAAGDGIVSTGAVNLIGWDGAPQGNHGELRLTGDGMDFVKDGADHRIAWSAIRRFSIEHTTRGLIRGTGGTLAGFAPQGAGQLYSAIRLGAEALSILYADEHQGLHAAVVILPRSSRDAVVQAFAHAGLQPADVLTLPPQEAQGDDGATTPRQGDEAPQPAQIRIGFPEASTRAMPAAYAAELYEQTVGQMTGSGKFGEVWRDGDLRAGPSAAMLSTTITHVRKGNAGARGALPVVGMFLGKTLIEADVRLTDASGRQLFDSRLKGSKSMPGESIGASKALAKSVSRSVGKTRLAQGGSR